MTTGMFTGSASCAATKVRALENERAVRNRYIPRTNCERAGFELGCRAETAAPVADYDTWLTATASPRTLNSYRNKITGALIRRAVIMQRNGYNRTEIARLLGVNVNSLGNWLHRLPPELAA